MTARAAIPDAVWQDLVAAVGAADRVSAPSATELARLLYGSWYLGGARALENGSRGPSPLDLSPADALRAAHADDGRWDPGWRVTGVASGGALQVRREGRRRELHRVDVLPRAHPCLPPRPGEEVAVTARRDAVDATGAFWFAYGGDWDEETVPPRPVRVYWNVRSAAAPTLVRTLTGRLGARGCAYALKVATGDRDVERPDRAVVYLRDGEAEPALRELAAAHRVLAPALGTLTPRLALRLADGVALAEDPDTGESFGEHRCRLVAEGLLAARRDGAATVSDRAAAVVEHLRDAGVDPAAPHLRPGSVTSYGWEAA